MYEVGGLLYPDLDVLNAPGLKASGWETETGEVGTEKASCVEENTWLFRERWGVSKEKSEVNQPMPGVLWRAQLGSIHCLANIHLIKVRL